MEPITIKIVPPSASVMQQPKWWTEGNETHWLETKKALLADWEKVAVAEKKLQQDVAEHAIAFGHGARENFEKLQHWGAELETKLAHDWSESHFAAHAWDTVRDAVKHGWARASDAVKAAAPK